MTVRESALKRGLDITAAAVGLVLLSPLLLAVAVAIRLNSPGSALFRQQRLGRGGRPFTAYKFRTMHAGAPDIRNRDGSAFNAANDARVTGAGRLLRQTSLDELPQLINVLTGAMSLVGPRPDQVDQLSCYARAEEGVRRLQVKPGITGLAQIGGRNSISLEERTRLDLEYVARQSLLLDLRILLQTLPYVLGRRDIYITEASRNAS